jgi:hypothetical protein
MIYVLCSAQRGAVRAARLLALAPLVSVVCSACSSSEPVSPPDPATVASVSIAPTVIQVVKGSERAFTLTALDSAGRAVSIDANWSSSAPRVATVSNAGFVSGVGFGSATITAVIGTHSAVAEVVVTALPTERAYSVLDLGKAGSAGDYGRHLSDSGDVLLGGVLVRHGAAMPLTGCPYPITLNGSGHVLCSIGKGDSVSSYAIWRNGILAPVAVADTFVAQHFRALAMNDSDEVAGLFYMPSFVNANCPATGVRCLSIWKNGAPTFPGYDAGGSDVMLMNNRRQAVVEYAVWNESVYGSVIYDIPTATSRQTQYGIRAFNENAWGAITSPWIAHGSSDPFRSNAYVTTPSALILLGKGGASGINDANVVVGTLDVGAFIWRGDGISVLTNASVDPAWTITAAAEINDRGQILATADKSDGTRGHAVILTPAGP